MLNKIFRFFFRDYPAYFWKKPNVYKILLLPVIFYYYLKQDDKSNWTKS